jgi:iron complex transport system ATP-binding protein
MGCGYVSNQAFGTLSQGEQQKVLIARARMTRPYVIILDEPCAGMDLGARENFLAGLTVLGRQKKVPALILVTHHVEEILPLFTRTLLLKDGRILEAGKTRDVLTRDALVRLFGIALDVIQKKGRTWVITK